MLILIVRWNWMVGEESGMFARRGWCKFDETFHDFEGK